MHNTEASHSDIILSTVNEIISEWEYYKDIIVDLPMCTAKQTRSRRMYTYGLRGSES